MNMNHPASNFDSLSYHQTKKVAPEVINVSNSKKTQLRQDTILSTLITDIFYDNNEAIMPYYYCTRTMSAISMLILHYYITPIYIFWSRSFKR